MSNAMRCVFSHGRLDPVLAGFLCHRDGHFRNACIISIADPKATERNLP